MSTEEQPATKIAEYTQTAAALAELRQRMAGVVYDITTTKGFEAAKKDRAELRTLRTGLEAKRKAIKEPALEHCRLIDAEAKRITVEIESLEDPIDKQIKAEEARKEAEKQAKLQAEQARVAGINARINGFQTLCVSAATMSSAEIQATLAKFEAEPVEVDVYEEYLALAQQKKAEAVAHLYRLVEAVKQREAEAAERERERQELAELRAAEERRRAEEEARRQADAKAAAERQAAEERAAAERRAKEEAEAKARREAEEREIAARRAQQEAEDRARREAIEAEERRLAAARAEVERQQREMREQQEARERAERERQEALAREEQARQEAEARAERARIQRERAAMLAGKPEDDILVGGIVASMVEHFRISKDTAVMWLRHVNLGAALDGIEAEEEVAA